MIKRQRSRTEAFLSLDWYELALRFLFTFVAKTSEVLLAAGLVVSTANFLTDGSILATHPGVSTAWAWAQALAIDSSLGVSLSYAFQCIKQDEWVRGVLYGLLTLLLALVAGAITTIDIVSHALHLSSSGAMMQMGINVAIISRLRAIAVIGFILMSRLRDLPLTALHAKTEPASQSLPDLTRTASRESRLQAAIQSLCSQFSAEETAQILNACIAVKKIVFTRVPPKDILYPHAPLVDQQSSEQTETRAKQGVPEQPAVSLVPSGPEPVSLTEPSRKSPEATEPQANREHHLLGGPEPHSQWLQVPEPIAEVSAKKRTMEQATAKEPLRKTMVQLESDVVPQEERLEQAYRLLLAEGKKPSGRALAEQAHVHRSTCVEWLRTRRQQSPENEQVPEVPEHDNLSVSDESLDRAVIDLSGKAPERETTSLSTEPADRVIKELPDMEMDHDGTEGNVLPGVSPDYSLPGDTLDVEQQSHPFAIR